MQEHLLDKVEEVRFWRGMGKTRYEIAKLVGLRNACGVRRAEVLLRAWGGDMEGFPTILPISLIGKRKEYQMQNLVVEVN